MHHCPPHTSPLGPPWRRLALALVAAISLTVSAPARADDASEAQLNFELGEAYYAQRRYAEAVERFLTSYRLVPNAQVAFNIARIYGLMERPIDAHNWYESTLALSDLTPSTPTQTATLAREARDALAPQVAVIEVLSEPAGAEIFVDRAELGAWGRAPRRVAVEPGERRVLLRLTGHHEASSTVTATRGALVRVQEVLRPITGTVLVTTRPAGAQVSIEGTREPLGISPLTLTLPIGEARLRAELPGRVPATASVTVTAEEARELELRLSLEATEVATLSVSGAPEGATVMLRGVREGLTPYTRSDLVPGTAELEVQASGLEHYRAMILLEAGSVTRVEVQLRPAPAWDWPLWRGALYTAAGVVLAGGTVFGVLALTQRDSFFEHPTRGAYDAVQAHAITSDVLLGAGAALLVATFIADLSSSPPVGSTAHIETER